MKKLELTVEGITVQITVRHATVADAMQRGLIASRLLDTEYSNEAEQAVAMMIYPRCMACVEGIIKFPNGETRNIQDLSVQEFIGLPYEIGEAWLAAVLEENPGWSLQAESGEEVQKKD